MSLDGDTPPSILYKYLPSNFPGSSTVPFFETGNTLRLTQPSSQNDLYECTPSLEGLDLEDYFIRLPREVAESDPLYWERLNLGHLSPQEKEELLRENGEEIRKKIQQDPDGYRSELLRRFRHERDQRLGILSLAESWSSSAMWGWYGGGNTGFVLGLRMDSPFFDRIPFRTYKVRYSHSKPPIENATPTHEELLNSILTKSQNWEHEGEWRVLAMSPVSRLQKLASSLDYRGNEIRGIEIPTNLIDCVVFGEATSTETKIKIATLAPTHVSLFEATPSVSSYDLERRPYKREGQR